MKEEWKVFIRGNKDRGEEVIKALTDLGGKGDVLNGLDKDCIYFIDHDGIIAFAYLVSETAQIIMDNYTELHLPEKWKDGDVLVSDEGLFFVLKGDAKVGDKNATIGAYCCVSEHQVCLSGHIKQIITPHLASPSEVEHFHELMHNYGKDWDAEKKQVVDWKWEPNYNEEYYRVLSDGTVHSCAWLDDEMDNSLFSIGNCFKTKEEAEIMAEKFKKLLKDKL